MQRGFVSIILAVIAISLGVGAAMHADDPTVRVLLIVGVSSLGLIVVVWLLAWCLPSMFGEWRKLAVPPGACPNCGFEVSGNDTRCPECDHRLSLFARRREPAPPADEEACAAEQAEAAVDAGATEGGVPPGVAETAAAGATAGVSR